MVRPIAMRAWRVVSIAAAVIQAAFFSAAPARAQTPHPLTGWWVSIDDGYLKLALTGITIPTEELMIVDAAGRAEFRFFNFYTPNPDNCAEDAKYCSDAPLIGRAGLRLEGADLVIDGFERRTAPPDTDTRLLDPLALPAISPRWQVQREAGGERLRLAGPGMTRWFARIDGERLKRLRSAFFMAELSATMHWRCFLSRATHDLPAFDLAGGPRTAPPAWLAEFVNAASLASAAGLAHQWPRADQGEAARKALANGYEIFLLPDHAGLRRADSAEAAERAQGIVMMFAGLMAGEERDAWSAQVKRRLPAFDPAAMPGASAVDALRRLRALATRGSDPDMDALFCNDGRSPDDPKAGGARPDFNPFLSQALRLQERR
jgi:hypothetical protein